MCESPQNEQQRNEAVEVLTEKMLRNMGFTKGQEVSVRDLSGGGLETKYWIQGIEIEISEVGSTTGDNQYLKLADLPLTELLNRSPFTVGTVLTFDHLESCCTPKVTKTFTVIGFKVSVCDYRLRPNSFDPKFLKDVSA